MLIPFVIILIKPDFLSSQFPKISQTFEIPQVQSGTENVSVTVIAGKISFHLSAHSPISLYNALTLAKENNQIKFSGKMYPSLGFFVTDIGTLHSGSGKNLLYYINGEEATVGVSAYALKDGDIVEWKLK